MLHILSAALISQFSPKQHKTPDMHNKQYGTENQRKVAFTWKQQYNL